ncbi:MAG: pilus assembly protein [Sphingomonadales bacterium]|nr:pilus assembly protein [Sphingomonadales bacterium]
MCLRYSPVKFARQLRNSKQAIAAVEFALIAPFLIVLIFTGLELAHYAIAKLRIAQLSRLAADVTGRYQPALSLTNVDDVITGIKLAGASIGFAQHGRIVISGLQQNAGANGQWINWQRCAGAKVYNSSWGTDDQGYATTTIQGMGPTGNQIAAPTTGIYIIFVEIAYDYQPLLPNSLFGNPLMTGSQAFIVRARQSGNIQGAYTQDSGGNYVRANNGTGARTATTQGATTDNCATYAA